MKKFWAGFAAILLWAAFPAAGYGQLDKDVIPTAQGDLNIAFIAHGTLMFAWNNRIVHVDPISKMTDYRALPKADLVLITHHHGDHLDPSALPLIKQDNTIIVAPELCSKKVEGCKVMRNGDTLTAAGIKIEAVPAYNIVHQAQGGAPFHVKGEGNGYVLTFGDKRVYVGGDTENTPEMKALKNIDVAFLPMNVPYTMTPEMAADAAKAFRPAVLYPYHYDGTDPQRLVELLKNEKDISVRVKQIYPPPAKMKR